MKWIKKTILIGWVVSVFGCNVFEWLTPPMSGVSAEELVYRGQQYFDKQQYENAAMSFEQAIKINPRSSEARLGYAKSLLWKVLLPVANIVAEEAHNQGNDISLGLLVSLNKKEFQDALFGGEVPLYKKIIETLEGPYGIVGNQGDGVIKDDNLEVNVVLLVAYFTLTSLNLLDSNGDKQFLKTPDYLVLQDGNIVFSLNIDRVLSNVTASTEITTSYTGDSLTNTLKGSHDALEELLGLLRFLYLNISYVDGMIGCVVRPSTFLRREPASSSSYANRYDEIRDALTNPSAFTEYTNSFRFLYVLRYAPTNVGRVCNDLHRVLVGSDAYSQLGDFRPSAWSSHNGGLKAYGEALAGVTLNDDNVRNVVTNITNKYTPQEISNLIRGLNL
ncbi:MAG: hypothetical protein N2314_00655 [Brevinematales bacterium]|nr:hypothetical protein [Brevinematales bacterium]